MRRGTGRDFCSLQPIHTRKAGPLMRASPLHLCSAATKGSPAAAGAPPPRPPQPAAASASAASRETCGAVRWVGLASRRRAGAGRDCCADETRAAAVRAPGSGTNAAPASAVARTRACRRTRACPIATRQRAASCAGLLAETCFPPASSAAPTSTSPRCEWADQATSPGAAALSAAVTSAAGVPLRPCGSGFSCSAHIHAATRPSEGV